MTMRKLLLGSAVAALLVPATSQAQSWLPAMRQCADEVTKELHCASCGGSWPLWTRCAVRRVYGDKIPSDKLEACIKKVWDRRWKEKTCANCGDPEGESIRCAGG